MRERIKDALQQALKMQDQRRISTLRLILAAIKDRDIAARGVPGGHALSDADILDILQKMVRQREEAARLYDQGGRPELAAKEREEIAIIRDFLPPQMSDADIENVCRHLIDESGATGLKDMGRTMALLRQRYSGRMDFGKAGGMVRSLLGGQGGGGPRPSKAE